MKGILITGAVVATLVGAPVAALAATAPVHPGDTLSGIAAEHGTTWQALYAANRGVVGSNPNLIYPGEQLTIPGTITAAVTVTGSYGHPFFCGDGDGDGYDLPCSALHHSAPVVSAPVEGGAPVAAAAPVTASSQQGSGGSFSGPTSSFQACVIQRESGGNAQVVNASGHYGLYQFSSSTWVAYGGNPADFGHASAAEQTQIFNNAIAAGGQSNWSPYDGCLQIVNDRLPSVGERFVRRSSS